ncbi:MAG: Ppx/GppA family phosphatase [Proteobacteria bacterium]|nr:Ppx/GppA family phosphatase [Pseudomonadota bacterium]
MKKYDHTFEAHTPAIASIDLGTNSCRLLIARVNIAGLQATYFRSRPRQDAWKIIDSVSKVVRLGEGLHNEIDLSNEAIDRAIDALAICKNKLNNHHIVKIRAVATEACRRAKNAHVLVDRAKNELGINLEIISGEEEARLAITGCAGVINPKIPYALVFDIGGGSTELAWLAISREYSRRPGYPVTFSVIGTISLPYGVVTVSEAYGNHTSNPKVCDELSAKISEELNIFFDCHGIDSFIKEGSVQLIGTSGTVTTLSAMALNLKRYERSVIDGAEINIKDLEDVTSRLVHMSEKERMQHPCVGGGRTDLVVVGAAILKGIYERADIASLRVADRGVREGILVDLLKEILRP